MKLFGGFKDKFGNLTVVIPPSVFIVNQIEPKHANTCVSYVKESILDFKDERNIAEDVRTAIKNYENFTRKSSDRLRHIYFYSSPMWQFCSHHYRTSPTDFFCKALLLQRGMHVYLDNNLYEVEWVDNSIHDMDPFKKSYPREFSQWKDIMVQVSLRRFTNQDMTKVILCKGDSIIPVRKVSLDKFQVLMHEEADEKLVLVKYNDSNIGGFWKAQRQEYTGKFAQKELRISVSNQILDLIDEIDNLEEEQIQSKLQLLNISRDQLRLYQELFRIYDEGDHECIVWVAAANLDCDEREATKIVLAEEGKQI